jgi:hypothetical protein
MSAWLCCPEPMHMEIIEFSEDARTKLKLHHRTCYVEPGDGRVL